MTDKKIGHRFTAGVSGNPLGRPRNAGNADRAGKIRVSLERNIAAVIDVVIKAALSGDIDAARLLIETYGLSDRISVSEPDVKVD